WNPLRVERLGEDRAARRVDDALLGERVADALDDPALDLTLRAEAVDHATDVVDRDDLVHPDLTRLDVDRHLCDLDAERQDLHPGWIRPARTFAQDLPALEQAGDLCQRPRAAVGGHDLSVLDVELPLL